MGAKSTLLVAYDVSTITLAGRRRLRRVAKVCLNYGQRVQFSLFECQVDAAQSYLLERDLLDIINLDMDNLRIYKLGLRSLTELKAYGKKHPVDLDGPLIV